MLTLSQCKIGDNSSNSTSSSFSVASIYPSDKSTSVPLNTGISVTFSDSVNRSTVTTNTNNEVCSGSFQVSGDGFNTCIQMSEVIEVGNGRHSFLFQPVSLLAPSSEFAVKITRTVRSGEGQALEAEYTSAGYFTSGSLSDTTAPLVTVVAPYSLYSRIPVNTGFMVMFSEAMGISTMTAATSGTECSGSVQLTSDGFLTCVRLRRDPEPSGNFRAFVITPAENLETNRAYKLKITTTAADAAGNPLAEEYLVARGMVTGSQLDQTAPSVQTISPANGISNISLVEPFTVQFNELMNPASIRANISGTACSEVIRVSTNNFVSCVQMISDINVINAGRSFVFRPASHMGQNSLYQLKVIMDAVDLAGNALSVETYYASGYTTTDTPWDYAVWDNDYWTD